MLQYGNGSSQQFSSTSSHMNNRWFSSAKAENEHMQVTKTHMNKACLELIESCGQCKAWLCPVWRIHYYTRIRLLKISNLHRKRRPVTVQSHMMKEWKTIFVCTCSVVPSLCNLGNSDTYATGSPLKDKESKLQAS